ncbi:hypothetical protein V3W47_14860 [Deinococcus sp. YIM 134068]|uniref:hypothetical protein n=1 Tax=Deinococcus lichenicola TaxID=3118910 RepID=UPI002F9530C3
MSHRLPAVLLAFGLLCGPPSGHAQAVSRQPTALQQARVQAAQETAQVRLLERAGQLRPQRVSASCRDRSGRVRLSVLADALGTPRIVRYARRIPDNTLHFTGYYDATGRLRFATAQASGPVGVLYNLSAEYDARGRLLRETGTRRAGYAAELRRLPNLNVVLLRRGICTL